MWLGPFQSLLVGFLASQTTVRRDSFRRPRTTYDDPLSSQQEHHRTLDRRALSRLHAEPSSPSLSQHTSPCLTTTLRYDPSNLKAGAAAKRHVGMKKGAILVDVENVRGKTGFALNHAELEHAMAIWTQLCGFQGKMSLIVDHGSQQTAYHSSKGDMTIIFAGPSHKADDLIAKDVSFLGEQGADLVVVTSDRGLIDRCKRAATDMNLTFLSPLTLVEDLEYILELEPLPLDQSTYSKEGDETEVETSDEQDVTLEPKIRALEHEIKLGAELLEAEALLRGKSGVNNKRRGKLKAKVRMLREKLTKSPSSLLQVVASVLDKGPQVGLANQQFTQAEQTALLARWDKVRRSSQRKEKTGDRVILAEQWRRELEMAEKNKKSTADDSSSSSGQPLIAETISMLHCMKYKCKDQPDIQISQSNSLRIVVISDTHGFENTLTNNDDDQQDPSLLPAGDVLIHLGDFAVDGSKKKEHLKDFDNWLAQQPHPIKWVVRGNHDPRTWSPIQSGATYITKPTTLTIGNFVFAFCPYLTGNKVSNKLMPRRADVLCTHVPPRDLLDRCYSGKHAGSATLRKGVERMASKSRSPPMLWLCGHIHEARGALRYDFSGGTSVSSPAETLIVNAAQANSGMARRLDHGPLVLQLEMDEAASTRRSKRKSVEIVQMDNQFVYLNEKSRKFFEIESKGEEVANVDLFEVPSVKLLLAVDLGLKTGFTVFNDQGNLLHYENVEYDSAEGLREGALQLMAKWEEEFSSDDGVAQITHVAIEGADVALRQIWREICHDVEGRRAPPSVLLVRPEEWRADLLNAKERSSGSTSKEAARLIARQIVADCSGKIHKGKFQTDVAESVLVGYHVCRRLGWILRKGEAVRRYSNGKIIVPQTIHQIEPIGKQCKDAEALVTS